MTPVVVALESSGLLSRIQEPADRRVSRVELTDAGRTTVAHVRSLRDAFLARRLSALGVADEDVRPLVELLENLVAE
jgi:DNA-binding MarR family transcriptional regulator